MERVIYINGELIPKDKAVVSVFDHGLLYGDGVFEGIRVYGGKVFRLAEHTRRLFQSAASIRLNIKMTQDEMNAAVERTVAANSDLTDSYIRLIVTRGAGNLGLNPTKCKEPQIIIIVDTVSLYSPELYESGLEAITAATVRNLPGALNPRIKSLNYLNNIMAKLEAIDAGVPESIMCNHLGFVAEASGENVFVIRDGVVYTPPVSAGILEGITRAEVMDICGRMGRTMLQCDLSRHDLYIADECFLTGTAAEVIPVVKIDGRVLGNGRIGPLTSEILAAFRSRTRG